MAEPDTLLHAPPQPACVGIILAAGHGRRYAAMAPGQDKLMVLTASGVPVAQAAAQAMRAATLRTLAVVRPHRSTLAALLAAQGCDVLTLDSDELGMGDSLAAAVRHLQATCPPGIQSCMVALADMPWLRAATCIHVAHASLQHGIVAPTWLGRRGHPVTFERSLWPELAALTGDTGARALLKRHPVQELAVDDPGVMADVDTPSDLLRRGVPSSQR